MFCPKCGAELPDGATRCPRCAAVLSNRAGRARAQAGNHAVRQSSVAKGQGAERRLRGAHAATGAHAPRPKAAMPAGSRDGFGANDAANAKNRAKSADADRRKFIAIVLAVAVVLAAAFLLWDTHLRPYGVNTKDFPSDGVRAAMAALDDDGDNQVTRAQVAGVTELVITQGSDVSGLGIFPNLKKLVVESDDVENVDATQASGLEELDASGASNLATVEFGTNAELSSVDLSGTAVTSVDLSNEPALSSAWFKGSSLSSLDISGCSSLASLDVDDTVVASLDLSGMSSLVSLSCADDVEVENLGETPLSAYWVVTDFQNSIPAYDGQTGEEVHMEASYDDDNRLTSVSYTDAAVSSRATKIAYSYDADGKLSSVKFSGMDSQSSAPSSNEWRLSYDSEGRMSKAAATSGASFEYEYNDDGTLASCTETSGSSSAASTTYSFEYEDGLLTNEEHGNFATEYSYDSKRRLTSAKTTYKGSSGSKDANTANSEASMSDASDTAAASDSAGSADDASREGDGNASAERVDAATFAYDSGGNCIRYNLAQHIGTEGTLDEKYSYDSDGRLVGASRTSKGTGSGWYRENRGYDSADYEYDDNGNLTGARFTRSDTEDATSESFKVKYHRVFATSDNAPVGGVWKQGYPFAISVNSGSYLASLVASASSPLTPWGAEPTFVSLVFDADTALFGVSAK